MRDTTKLRASPLVILLVGAGCSGNIGPGAETNPSEGSGATSGGAGSSGMKPPGGAGTGGAPNAAGGAAGGPSMTTSPSSKEAGPRAFSRLSQEEYLNAITDLFPGVTPRGLKTSDPLGEHGFAQPALVTSANGQDLIDTSQALAQAVVEKLATVFPCDVTKTGEDACAASFVSKMGRRIYRRSLSKDDTDGLLGLYASAKNDLKYTHPDRMRVVLTAMLMSPSFLYRWERGTSPAIRSGDIVQLTPFELASRLSFFLWSSTPDDALLDAAESGALASDAGLSAQIDRMMTSDKLRRTAETFHVQWLKLSSVLGAQKDGKLYPDYGAPLQDAMLRETKSFFDYVMTTDGKLSTLFTSNVGFVNGPLAKVYGVAGVTGDTMKQVELDKTTRAGILTRAAVITTLTNPGVTNPPRAGRAVYTGLLCQPMKQAAADIVAQFKPDAAKTTRENFSVLDGQPECKGCHAQIDPLGYAFESYDAIGRTRTKEGTKAVDSSGVLTSGGSSKPFANLAELGALLAADPGAQACVAQTWTRFALGRLETDGDKASFDAAMVKFKESGFDVRVFLKAFAASKTFRFRSPDAEEML